MLRRKLSKLIVASMATALILGVSMFGQAAHSTEHGVMLISAEVGSKIARSIQNITSSNINDFVTYLKDSRVEILYVETDVTLTAEAVEAINSRTSSLEIVVRSGATLSIEDSVNLNGDKSNLIITRDSGKTGALLQTQNKKSDNGNTGGDNNGSGSGDGGSTGVDNNGNGNGGSTEGGDGDNEKTETRNTTTTQVTISGVTFNNNNQTQEAFLNGGSNFKVTLKDNRVVGGGYLSSTTGISDITFSDNLFYGGSSISVGQKLTVSSVDINLTNLGSTSVDLVGKVNLGTSTGNVKLNTIDLEIVNSSNTFLKTVSVLFNDNEFSTMIDGLTAGTGYTVRVKNIEDENGNEYEVSDAVKTFTTFKATVTDIRGNTANLKIERGSIPDSAYPLTVTLTSSSSTKSYRIESSSASVLALSDLTLSTDYTYEIKDNSGHILDKASFRTASTSSSTGSIISGGSSNSSGSTITGNGSSSVTGSITSNDINRSEIKDTSVSIPVSSSTVASNLNNGRDLTTNVEGVTAKYENGKVELSGLVPEKEYKNVTLSYRDSNGNSRSLSVPTFTTKTSTTKSGQFVKDVYSQSLNRLPDERGFAYWEDQIQGKKTAPEDFVRNLLSEKEFSENNKTTSQKIEALYQVIVNRTSDPTGLAFWTDKYNSFIAQGYTDSTALSLVADQMVSEQEFKTRVSNLGL